MTEKEFLDLRQRIDEFFSKFEELNNLNGSVEKSTDNEKLKELEMQRTLLTAVVALSATSDEAKKALKENIDQIDLSASSIKANIAREERRVKLKEFLNSEATAIAEVFSNFGNLTFEEEIKPVSISSRDKDSGNDIEAATTVTATEKTSADSDSDPENNSGNVVDLFITTLRVLEEHIKEVSGQSENFKSYPAEFETEYEGICSQLSEEYVGEIIPGFDSWESKAIIYSLPTAFLKAIGRTDVVRARATADWFYYKGQRNKWRPSLTLTTVEELKKLASGFEKKKFILENADTRGATRRLKYKAFCRLAFPEEEETTTEETEAETEEEEAEE